MQKSIKSFDDVKINYEIHRFSEGKEFLVFLHGMGGDLTAWKKERQFFHKQRISTVAIDLRGHGLSDRPGSIISYNLENFARDVYRVVKKENIRDFVIVGHCFGGVVTINFQKLYPTLAKAYVLVDTTYKTPQRMEKSFKDHPLFIYILNAILGHKKLQEKHFSHVNFDKFIGTGDWNLRRIFSDIMHTSFKSWLFTYENLAHFDGVEILKSINKPVLIIEGEKDTIFDVLSAEKMKNLIKASRLDIIPEANHIIVINNPDVLEKEILNFVSSIRDIKK